MITGVFSSVNEKQEEYVKKVIKQIDPSLSITASHDVGLIGFLERENASILNESLKPLCVKTIDAFKSALQRIGLPCPFYLTQNDGTIIRLDPKCTISNVNFKNNHMQCQLNCGN